MDSKEQIVMRRWLHGKLAVLDISESGRQIGEKLFALLDTDQRKELVRYIQEQGVQRYFPKDPGSISELNVRYGLGKPLTEIAESNLYVCLENRFVSVTGTTIELTAKEFDILTLLALHPRRVFTYEMITELIWKEAYATYSRKAIINHISNLRKKLKISMDTPDYIKSVHGVGYKFDPTF